MESRFFEVLTKKNQAWVAYQSDEWYKKSKPEVVKKETPILPFITISREYGCAGFSLGELLANELNKPDPDTIPWAVYDKMLLEKIQNDHGIQKVLLESMSDNTRDEISDFFSSSISMRPSQSSLYRKFFATQRALAYKGYVILIGRGAVVSTNGLEGGFHVRIYAPQEFKIAEVRKMHGLASDRKAELMLKKVAKERDAFVKKYLKTELSNPALYDIMINNNKFSRTEMVDVILTGLRKRGFIR